MDSSKAMGIDEVGPTEFGLTGCRLSVLPLLNVYSSVVATDQRKPNTQKHKCTSFFNMCLCFVCRFSWSNLEDLQQWLSVREVEYGYREVEEYVGATYTGKWQLGKPDGM